MQAATLHPFPWTNLLQIIQKFFNRVSNNNFRLERSVKIVVSRRGGSKMRPEYSLNYALRGSLWRVLIYRLSLDSFLRSLVTTSHCVLADPSTVPFTMHHELVTVQIKMEEITNSESDREQFKCTRIIVSLFSLSICISNQEIKLSSIPKGYDNHTIKGKKVTLTHK